MTNTSNDQDTGMTATSAERASLIEATDESGASGGAGAISSGGDDLRSGVTGETSGTGSEPASSTGRVADDDSHTLTFADPTSLGSNASETGRSMTGVVDSDMATDISIDADGDDELGAVILDSDGDGIADMVAVNTISNEGMTGVNRDSSPDLLTTADGGTDNAGDRGTDAGNAGGGELGGNST